MVPSVWVVGHAALVLSSAFMLVQDADWPGWIQESPVTDVSTSVDLIGNTVFSLLAVGLLVSATIRRDNFGNS